MEHGPIQIENPSEVTSSIAKSISKLSEGILYVNAKKAEVIRDLSQRVAQKAATIERKRQSYIAESQMWYIRIGQKDKEGHAVFPEAEIEYRKATQKVQECIRDKSQCDTHIQFLATKSTTDIAGDAQGIANRACQYLQSIGTPISEYDGRTIGLNTHYSTFEGFYNHTSKENKLTDVLASITNQVKTEIDQQGRFYNDIQLFKSKHSDKIIDLASNDIRWLNNLEENMNQIHRYLNTPIP